MSLAPGLPPIGLKIDAHRPLRLQYPITILPNLLASPQNKKTINVLSKKLTINRLIDTI